ncbi:unnamed protein product [Prorocentrum cordatum]|uniref:HEAT repeat-containing protein 1 n=1 Tax=Prorocentrum cordatum TaxID=2364126 RepID=A0ABN9UA26_9DINO|nr:unnamed protein product [Polarella glacialis]
MLQKMLLDKAITVRTCAGHALADLASASPSCVGQGGDAMAVGCLKQLATDVPAGQSSLSSEFWFAFSRALAHVLAAMATPGASVEDRPKKKLEVTDLASAAAFLEKAASKGPPAGSMFVAFRASICLAAVRLVEVLQVFDAPSITLVMRLLVGILDGPQLAKASRSAGSASGADEESMAQVGHYVSGALRQLLQLSASAGETVLLEVIETGLIPLASSQVESSRSTGARMAVVLEALSSGCAAAGEAFRGAEAKIARPLLHLVGHHPNPAVQLGAAYCLRAVAHGSPPQLFQIMSSLLKLATVQNAELLGTPVPRAGAGPDLTPLMHGLFGHCAALASLVGELFHSDLGVPHDVTNAVLNTSRALLQPHLNTTVSAQRRSCAFILLEGLMCLGTDWVGQRLTTLFALWKAGLGKKPVDRAKHQQHAAAASQDGGAQGGSSEACRDELLSLLCALRSLYAFTLHSNETLLVSLPHLHKILVVFLTHVSQLVVALPHPASPSFRARHRRARTVSRDKLVRSSPSRCIARSPTPC